MQMRIEIRKTKTFANLGKPKFYYRLVGANNEIMMSSQPIKHKRSCFDSAEAIRDAFKSPQGVALVDKTFD